MKLLIDGYNLLKYLHGPSVGEQQRHACTQIINSYARLQSIKPWIIYDGGSDTRPTQEIYGLVTIVYVGWKSTADNYIQEYITTKEHRHEELLLVSSDRELALYADTHTVPSIDVALFWRLVQLKCTQPTPAQENSHTHIVKLSTTHNPELDELMYSTHTTTMPSKNNLEEVTLLIRNTHKSSKAETKLLKIIKKLL